MKKRVRLGARQGFLQKANGLLFSFAPGTTEPRKSLTTKTTFIGVILLGAVSAIGTTITVTSPQTVGQQPGLDQYLTGAMGVLATYGMYKAADDMANNWWVLER